MFKPHYGSCSFCSRTNVMIAVKSGACIYCNHEKKEAKKKASGKKTSGHKYIREATGEGEMFREIAINMLGDEATRCWICGIPIAAVTYSNMAHILPKGKYPLFRLNPDNIRLLCHKVIADDDGRNGCHNQIDARPRSEIIDDPKWQKFFELEGQLKQQYKQLENSEL